MSEASDAFACFGGTCAVFAGGDGGHAAVAAARSLLLSWHDRFTRFDPASELSRLNADRRKVVPVTPLMARFAAAVAYASELTGGLVDGTLLGELETAGYRSDLGAPLDLGTALLLAPDRRPAALRTICSIPPAAARRSPASSRPRRWRRPRSRPWSGRRPPC